MPRAAPSSAPPSTPCSSRAGDERSASQRRADALVDLARRQLDIGDLPEVAGDRPHLTLTADLATLAGQPGAPAGEMEWGHPVPAETVRRVACDAVVTPMLVGEGGEPLSVGRARRVVPAAVRRALAARSGARRGCRRRVRRRGCNRRPAK